MIYVYIGRNFDMFRIINIILLPITIVVVVVVVVADM